jgi:shikimate kinase
MMVIWRICAHFDMKNIILTGFMGTGKSSIGKMLAVRLGYRYVDLDVLIVEQAGEPINEIFAREGEPHFRSLETRMLANLAGEKGLVLSTGGGAVIAEENRRLLHDLGVIVNLTASAEEIQHRLQHEHDRPLLNDNRSQERIVSLLEAREPFYADADVRIETSGKSVDEVLNEILAWLKRVGTIGQA